MAYDSEVSIRQGGVRTLFATVVAQTGATLAVQGGGTFSLFDSLANPVAGFAGVPFTGSDGGSLPSARAWYLFPTGALVPGVYLALFSIVVLGSDTITRTIDVEIEVTVLARVEIAAATYDPTTPIGLVRILIGDTTIGSVIWSDAEITAALTAMQNEPRLSASLLLDGAASDSARMAVITKSDAITTDLSKVASGLRDQAQYLRKTAIISPVVYGPDQIFIMADTIDGVLSTMDWER